MRTALVLLCVLAAIGGCSLNDCSFETSRTTTNAAQLVADGASVGDTLTVAIVVDSGPVVQVTVGAGVGTTPPTTADGSVEVLYDAVAVSLNGDRASRPLDATLRGDTLFVYVRDSLDPGLLQLTCSLPTPQVEVDVRAILVPDGTVAARVTTLSVSDLTPSTSAALRATAEAGRVTRATHV